MSNHEIYVGHSIYLRLPEVEDVENCQWHHWFNDLDATKYNSHGTFFISKEFEENLIESKLNKISGEIDMRQITFAVCAKIDNKVVGCVSLTNIDLINRKAELGVMIGNKDYRNKTTGLEAIALMAEHAFTRLNLNKLYGALHEKLDPWLILMGFVGVERTGLLVEDGFRNGEYFNNIMFALFSKNFFALKKERNSILYESPEVFMKKITQYSLKKSKLRHIEN